jgi:hypothetical protein
MVRCADEACVFMLKIPRLRYDALRAWNAILKAKESEYWVPLKAGTAVGRCDLVPMLDEADGTF